MNANHPGITQRRRELLATCTTIFVTLAGWGYLVATLGERLLAPTIV